VTDTAMEFPAVRARCEEGTGNRTPFGLIAALRSPLPAASLTLGNYELIGGA